MLVSGMVFIIWMIFRNTYDVSFFLFVWDFFRYLDSSYPRWWDAISSPSLFKLFLDSPLQLSSSNVSLRSSESAIVTTCVVGFVVVGAWFAKVNWNRWMKFRSQWMDSVGVEKMHEGMGIGRIGSQKNCIFQGAWVRSVFEPYGIVKE